MAAKETVTNALLKSNEAINKIIDSDFAAGILNTINNLTSKSDVKEDIFTAISRAHRVGNVANGKLNMKSVAGTAIGTSAAVRLASGGGVYRDSDGNANLIGIPFV